MEFSIRIFLEADIKKQSSKTCEELRSQKIMPSVSREMGIDVPDKIIIVDDIYTTGLHFFISYGSTIRSYRC